MAGQKRKRHFQRFAGIFAAVVALAFPSGASAGYWSWGFNYIGPNLNNPVESGFNNWYDQYVDKRNGGELYVGWHTGTYPCWQPLYGATTLYQMPTRCGWGGWYIRNILAVLNPNANMSYTFADSIA